MDHLPHILFSEESKKFTYLNAFDRKRNLFQGEYSVLHNHYENGQVFLSRFIYNHLGEPITIVNVTDPRYREVTNDFTHFMEDDIDKYIEDLLGMQDRSKEDLKLERGLGQLQLMMLKKAIEEKIKSLQNSTGQDPKILLGRELSLEWVLQTLNDYIEKGERFYK